MKFSMLLIACGLSLAGFSQQKTADALDGLMPDLKQEVKIVDSLRKIAVRQKTRIETLNAKLASVKNSKLTNSAGKIHAVKAELAAEYRRFDLELGRLDSCTNVLIALNKQVDSVNGHFVRAQ